MSLQKKLATSRLGLRFLRESFRYMREIHSEVKGGLLKDRRTRNKHARVVLEEMALPLEEPNREELYATYPCIYVGNHLSLLDPLILCAVFDRNVRFLAKSSVFKVPFLGTCMRAEGHIEVFRGKAAKRNSLLHSQVESALNQGDAVFFFAEGTRSRDGSLQAFKLGAFFEAIRLNVPIVPVIFEGTGKALPKNSWAYEAVPCSMRVLPAVYPEDLEGDERSQARNFSEKVHKIMREALGEV